MKDTTDDEDNVVIVSNDDDPSKEKSSPKLVNDDDVAVVPRIKCIQKINPTSETYTHLKTLKDLGRKGKLSTQTLLMLTGRGREGVSMCVSTTTPRVGNRGNLDPLSL